MRAVLPPDPEASGGGETSPRLGELPRPIAGSGEVVLAVRATALNRADLLQLRGLYPPPAGESPIPGLEASGVVESTGEGVRDWAPGDRAMVLLGGGGHAELVAAPEGQFMPIPATWSFEEAAAIPEAAITAWTNLVEEGRLTAGETVLVTGATSGVGTFIVQLARELGARVFAVGRDRERLEAMARFGAERTFLLDDGLAEEIRVATAGRGVDLVVDLVAGPHVNAVLGSLAQRGRFILIGLMAGRTSKIDLGIVLRNRLHIVGSVLRPRSRQEKARLVARFLEFAGERLRDGRLRPVIARVFPFAKIAEAYAELDHGRPLGKVVVSLE